MIDNRFDPLLNRRMRFRITFTIALLLLAAFAFPVPAIAADETKPSPPPEMVTYYFVLLVRGPKWTPEKTAETAKIQEGHMANMQAMHEAGKLALAGPFADTGNWRGIFVLKTASLEEAKSLVEKDPAIKAGRLAFEIHPWMTQKGVLP
jgi:uncharacterized protein YciI